MANMSLHAVLPVVFFVVDIKGFCVSGGQNLFYTGKTSTPYIRHVCQVTLMHTRHSPLCAYVIKVIVSWLIWNHSRHQWLWTKPALQVKLENFIAACLHLELSGVCLTVLASFPFSCASQFLPVPGGEWSYLLNFQIADFRMDGILPKL